MVQCICCQKWVNTFARLSDGWGQREVCEYAWDEHNFALGVGGPADYNWNFTVCEECYKESGLDRERSWALVRTS
jgi:hypothetical protein